MSIVERVGTRAKIECRMELRPATPGMSMNEALDKFQSADSKNTVHDYGTNDDVVILGWNTRTRIVGYEFVPELSPPGFTIQNAIDHMRAAGFDVRGLNETGTLILVSEDY